MEALSLLYQMGEEHVFSVSVLVGTNVTAHKRELVRI